VLYYLRERITHKNLEVKYLVATNINEWFIFDATLFECSKSLRGMPLRDHWWCILVAKYGAFLFTEIGAFVITDYSF
jgi:hypothetical protein